MPSSALRRIPSAFALLLALLLAGAAIMVTPLAATAHDELLRSSPAADEQVETLPAQLTLDYSASLLDGEGATLVEVTGPDGFIAHASDAVVDGHVVSVPLVDAAPAGAYQVLWRVVSSDGHPISGEFAFEVLTGTLAPETTPSEEPETPTSEEEPQEAAGDADTEAAADADAEERAPSEASRVFFSPVVIAILIAGVGFVLLLAFVAFRARSRRSDDGTK